MTTFSIIIPVYNVAPYLRECLDSVLAAARTLSEKCKVKSVKCKVDSEKWGGDSEKRGVNSEKCGVEIICVDDGSTACRLAKALEMDFIPTLVAKESAKPAAK